MKIIKKIPTDRWLCNPKQAYIFGIIYCAFLKRVICGNCSHIDIILLFIQIKLTRYHLALPSSSSSKSMLFWFNDNLVEFQTSRNNIDIGRGEFKGNSTCPEINIQDCRCESCCISVKSQRHCS